jgi:excisionase family DNA binding protein
MEPGNVHEHAMLSEMIGCRVSTVEEGLAIVTAFLARTVLAPLSAAGRASSISGTTGRAATSRPSRTTTKTKTSAATAAERASTLTGLIARPVSERGKSKMMNNAAAGEKPAISYTIAEAVKATGIGRSSLYEAIKAGELAAKKRGAQTLIKAEELARYVDALPDAREPA